MPRDHDAVGVRQVTDPVELREVGFHSLGQAQRLIQDQAVVDQGKHRSVMGAGLLDIVDGLNARGAREIFRDVSRIARDVLDHGVEQQPGILVEISTRRGANDNLKLLALVEISDFVCAGCV
jgi:hypothetical protein